MMPVPEPLQCCNLNLKALPLAARVTRSDGVIRVRVTDTGVTGMTARGDTASGSITVSATASGSDSEY